MAKQRMLETSQEEESRVNLMPDDFNYGSGHNYSVIIDFLSYIRGQYLEKIDQKKPSAPLLVNLTAKHT